MRKSLLLFLLLLKTDASVNGLDLSQKNSLENSNLFESEVTQGSLRLYDSVLSSTVIQSRNSIENTDVSSNSMVQQSVVEVVNGSVLKESKIRLRSLIDNSHIALASYVAQNRIVMNNALLDASLIESYSVLNNAQVKESVLSQGEITLASGTKIENDSSLKLHNSVNGVSLNTSQLYQGGISMRDTTLNNVEVNSNHLLTSKSGRVILENAMLIQGEYRIHGSKIDNSRLESKSVISDTTISDSTVNMCSNYMNEVMLSNTNIEKRCVLENSRVSNGATLYKAMTKFN